MFGYVTEGKDFLDGLKVGDVIESVRILSGEENLVRKQDPAPPSVVEVAAAEAPAVAAE